MDGGSEADDESLRKMKTNKQRLLSNQMYVEQSLQRRTDNLGPLRDDVEVKAEGMKCCKQTHPEP